MPHQRPPRSPSARRAPRLTAPTLAAALAATLGAITTTAHAQWNCSEPEWGVVDESNATFPGLLGFLVEFVHAGKFDPDGSGPATPVLIVSGIFEVAGDIFANNIAAHDPSNGQWEDMGTGVNGYGRAFADWGDGTVIVGGMFTQAGGLPVNHIAKWDGATWSDLDGGVTGDAPLDTGIEAVLLAGPGELYASGDFTYAGGLPASRVARWDGAQWHALGGGISGGSKPIARSLARMSDGSLIVAGTFTTAGSSSASNIASWNGVSWSALGGGITDDLHEPAVHALAVMPDGSLIVGGSFKSAGGVLSHNIARWADGLWSSIGSTTGQVNALAIMPDGALLAGGEFLSAGGVPGTFRYALWNGSLWSALSEFSIGSPPHSLTPWPDGSFFAGGPTGGGTTRAHGLVRWTPGTGWQLPSGAMNNTVTALAIDSNNALVAAGPFSSIDGVKANRIARRVHGEWQPLGEGVVNPTEVGVRAIAELPSGDLVVGGDISKAGQVAVNRIARWDGASWHAMGQGVTSAAGFGPYVFALDVQADGGLLVGGDFTHADGIPAGHVARWQEGDWTTFGTGMNGSVRAIVELPDGGIVAGGEFAQAGSIEAKGIARWDGQDWNALGAGLNGTAAAILVQPSGDLVVGGQFTDAGGVSVQNIARWDGQVWHDLGGGLGGNFFYGVSKLLPLDSGPGADQFIAAGGFTQSASGPLLRIARWSGEAWLPVGTGLNLSNSGPSLATALALVRDSNGAIYVGGEFGTAGGTISPFLARYGCPAPPPCYADCDASGTLTIDDFICFQTLYAVGDPAADCDGSGNLNIDDFICFQTFFALGC